MAVEWYLLDWRDQYGPLGTVELRQRLASYTDLEKVLIWREGLQDWKPVADVFESFDTPGALNQRKRVKARWAFYGLTLGVLLCASDIVLEWRGKQFLPWNGNEAEDIGRVIGSVGVLTLLFFLAGAIKDALFSRWKIRSRPGLMTAATPPPIAPEKSAAPKHDNFIAKNWRGEYPLLVSYWVFGLVGNLAIAVVPIGLSAVFEARSGYQPTFVFALIVSVWVVSVVISVWQWVSVWRSANRYIEQKSLKLERAPWAGLAKLMAVMAFLQLAATVAMSGIPQVTEVSRIAFMDDPGIPGYSIRVMRNGTEAEITGGIKYGLTDDFGKILRASRQVRVVHLNSIGGRIGEGEKLYKLIKQEHLNTYVSAKCLSACTLAFSGGTERVLLHGAVLGFHRAAFAGEEHADSPELEGQRKIFTEAGYDAPFIAHALATPNSDMWKPPEPELLKSGVITKVSHGSDYSFSGLPPDVSRDWFSNSLTKSASIYLAVSSRFPKEYDDMVGSYYDAFVTGKTEAEATALLSDKLTKVISANRHLADDDVLIDAGNLIADQLAVLQKQSPASCYNYAKNGVFDAALMPPGFSKREQDVEERIVRTAAKRPDADASGKELWSKLSSRLSAKGIAKGDLDLIQSSKVADSQQARFCSALTTVYREAAALPQKDGAVVLRALLSAK